MTYQVIRVLAPAVLASTVLACAGGGESPDWDDPACVALALAGLPCSSGGGAQQVVTVQQIQQMEDPMDPVCPGTGPRVVVHNVVLTAVDTYDEDGSGRVGGVWVQDPGGGAQSGVQLYNPVVIPSRTRLVPGDIVDLIGTVDEFVLCNPDGTPMDRNGTLTEIGAGSVQKVGETLPPDPVVIAEAELATLASAEPWEGCLVRLENVTMSGPYDRYDELTTAGGVKVANDLYEIPGVAAGVHYAALSGVVTYFFGFKLLPRGPQDVEP
jgi:hypothetical protein